MTKGPWWQDALAGWAAAARQTYRLRSYAAGRSHRGFGEWWKDGDTWCLHLSSTTFAVFSDDLPAALRATLAWTLQQMDQGGAVQGSSAILGQLTQFMTASRDELESWLVEGSADKIADTRTIAAWQGPGCYILVEPTERNGGAEDIVSLLAEVVEAVLPDSRLGEVELAGQLPKLLLFYPQKELEQRMAADGATTSPTGVLRDVLSELADALESDAMVPCTLWSGRLAKAPNETGTALLTLALMWQEHRHVATRRNVHIWGEQPIQVLLAGLPRQVRAWFIEAARAVQPLPEELNEALAGLIAANLNVSEAARQMYVHRNTFIHRVERIREQTGYDVRNFWEALLLWLQEELRDR